MAVWLVVDYEPLTYQFNNNFKTSEYDSKYR